MFRTEKPAAAQACAWERAQLAAGGTEDGRQDRSADGTDRQAGTARHMTGWDAGLHPESNRSCCRRVGG